MLSHVVKISDQTGDKIKAVRREIAGPVSRKQDRVLGAE